MTEPTMEWLGLHKAFMDYCAATPRWLGNTDVVAVENPSGDTRVTVLSWAVARWNTG